MKTINLEKCFLRTVLSMFMLLALILSSSMSNAQDWSRKGKGELYFLGQSMSGDTASGLGITLKLKDTYAGGFGFGINIIDYLNLNWDLIFGSMDITGKAQNIQINSSRGMIWGMDVNLDYNILKFKFTPLITGGLGFLGFSGSFDQFSFSETDLSYNLGVGFRWDIARHFFTKVLYRATWTKLKDTDKTIMFAGPCLNIGFLF
jgi:opacity protein-like surface antigen